MSDTDLGDDVLVGAAEIAAFLKMKPRAVYHLVSSHRFPVFRLGTAQIRARKSVLIKFIEDQERRNGGALLKPDSSPEGQPGNDN